MHSELFFEDQKSPFVRSYLWLSNISGDSVLSSGWLEAISSCLLPDSYRWIWKAKFQFSCKILGYIDTLWTILGINNCKCERSYTTNMRKLSGKWLSRLHSFKLIGVSLWLVILLIQFKEEDDNKNGK